MKSPVVLFIYNRCEHSRRTIEALAADELAYETDLIIYSDGPRETKEGDDAKVRSIRDMAENITGFASVTLIKRDKNMGLAANIEAGVTETVNKYGRVIVLEDDIIVKPGFLRYMNDALDKYENEKRVMEISAYMNPIDTEGLPDAYFIKCGFCWGWATWADRWKYYERDPEKIYKAFSKDDRYHFNTENRRGKWEQVFHNLTGRMKTWAVFWEAAIYLQDGYTLVPRENLITNSGFDGSGEHEFGGRYDAADSSRQGGFAVAETASVNEEISWKAPDEDNKKDTDKGITGEEKREKIIVLPGVIEENAIARTRLHELFAEDQPDILHGIYYGVKETAEYFSWKSRKKLPKI